MGSTRIRIGSVIAVAVVAALLFAPGMASAASLPAASTLFKNAIAGGPPMYDSVLPGWAILGNQVASLVSPLTDQQWGTPDFTGTLSSAVYLDPGTGHLLFTYMLSMGAASTAEVVRLTMNGYAGWAVSGAVGADGSGSSGSGDLLGREWSDGDPAFLSRNLSGDTISAQFRTQAFIGAGLWASDSSSIIFFETDATGWQQDTAQVINGTVATATALVPNVPEPGVLAMLASGIAALGLGLRRRFLS